MKLGRMYCSSEATSEHVDNAMISGKLYKNLSNQTLYVQQSDKSYSPEQALLAGEYFLFLARVPAGYKMLVREHIGLIAITTLVFPDEPWRYFIEVTDEERKALQDGS